MIMISKNVIGIYEGGGGRIAAGGGLFAGGPFAAGLIAVGLFASGLNAAPPPPCWHLEGCVRVMLTVGARFLLIDVPSGFSLILQDNSTASCG